MSKKLATPKFWSIYLGNLFEHYDGALFGFLSPFLAPLIFPNTEYITALILTYGMIPLGMVAKPIGSLFFGYIGDFRGRKEALVIALFGMAMVSLLIAFSPTYVQAGALSPILFCIGRGLQNFFAAGESMGGAIFLLEDRDPKERDFFSSLYNTSTIAGILLASGGVALLSVYHKTDFGWRVLYILGAATALFALLIRREVEVKEEKREPSKRFIENKGIFFAIVIASGFAYANYSMALVFINGFVPLISSVTKGEMIQLNTLLLVLDFLLLPVFGWLSSKIGRKTVMLVSALTVLLFSAPLFLLLKGGTLFTVFCVRAIFVAIGVAFFAPFHAWTLDILPKDARYRGTSFGYSLGSQLLGGPFGALSLWIFKETDSIPLVTLYWSLLASMTVIVILRTSKTARPEYV